ncbi:MAG: MFS transporter [Alphaproteobacteria bacterium]|nr:MFS transporter [Alphaproteobacteria bacterium]
MAGIAALLASYILSQFYRSFLAVLTPNLIDELGADKADLSLASGGWFMAFALMQFAVGVSLDRFGPRRTAAYLLAVGGGGGALLFALASSPFHIILAMALIGIGCSPVLMAAFFLFARIYPAARFAVLSSWFVATGTAGNVIGAKPLAIAVEAFGWRPSMMFLGVVTLVIAIAILKLVEDPEIESDDGSSQGFSGYVQLLKTPVLWLIIPLIAIHYAPSAGIRGLWIGPYLADVYDASLPVIGNITLFMAISMILGAFLYGPLDTIFRTRKWVAAIGNGGSLLSLVLLAFLPSQPLWQVSALMFAAGLFGASYGLLIAHAKAFFPVHLIGRGVTLMNFFAIGGVGVMQFVTGRVVTATFDPAAPERAFSMLFATYAALLAASLFIYLFISDKPPSESQ